MGSVTGALLIPEEEQRFVVSLDMQRMTALKWIDINSQMACFEAGIRGPQLEQTLRQYGYCFGHEPDSHEFSSLGGWVATKASGMKKNVYGNIEDVVLGLKVVTPRGVMEK